MGIGVGSVIGAMVDGVIVMGGGVTVGWGFTTTPVTTPAAAAPATMSAIVPAAMAAPPAANPRGAMAAPEAAEKTVTSPGGPKAAILRSPQSSFFSTMIASISVVWLSSNSVVVDCR